MSVDEQTGTMHTSASAQTTDERVRLDELLGDAAVPRSNGELVFDAPWHARAFGMTVSLCQAGEFEWAEFQTAISKRIAETGQQGVDQYYECWLDALTTVLGGAVEHHSLHVREAEFRNHERDEVF